MEIRELRHMEVGRLVQMAADLKVRGAGSLPRRELLFKVIRAQAGNGEIVAEGVLERLSEGYGFLRGSESSYLPGNCGGFAQKIWNQVADIALHVKIRFPSHETDVPKRKNGILYLKIPGQIIDMPVGFHEFEIQIVHFYVQGT